VRMTRIKIRKIIKKETMEKMTKRVTRAKNIIKYYVIRTSYYYYSLTRTVSETY
jgi:hypothetical protein